MANSSNNRNVRIGADGTIYIGDEPQGTSSTSSSNSGSGTRANTGTGNTQQSATSNAASSTTSSTASSSATDSDTAAWVIGCAIVGAIAFYFVAAAPGWAPAVGGAIIGAICALLPRASAGFWIFGFIVFAFMSISQPSYTFFQVSAPMMTACALFACMGLLRYNESANAWEMWAEVLIIIVAALSLAVSTGFVQLNYSTPVIGPAYAELVASSNTNEECAEAFAMQYFTNVTSDSKKKDKPEEIKDWEDRVRAYIKPGSPAERKFDNWLKSAPSHSLGFLSIAEKAKTTSSGRNVVTVTVTYRGTQNTSSSLAYATTQTETFTCTMSEDHFIWDIE